MLNSKVLVVNNQFKNVLQKIIETSKEIFIFISTPIKSKSHSDMFFSLLQYLINLKLQCCECIFPDKFLNIIECTSQSVQPSNLLCYIKRRYSEPSIADKY